MFGSHVTGRGEIREERPGDVDEIHELHRRAFGSEAEAMLVDRLRDDGLVVASLVCSEDGHILGHVLFSELPITRGDELISAAALAPVAVLPGRQGQGIGSALIQAGLERCRIQGLPAVIVLGNPAFYGRFGFSAETARELDSPYTGPAFMAVEFEPGILETGGVVCYPGAFRLVD